MLDNNTDQNTKIPLNSIIAIVEYSIDTLPYPNADVRHKALQLIGQAYMITGYKRLEKLLLSVPVNLREPLANDIP